MTGKLIGALFIVMSVCNYSFAKDITPDEIFPRVIDTYSSMKTYKAQAANISDIGFAGEDSKLHTETSFSILLKKPNLYLISWIKKNKMKSLPNAGEGTVWSDGTQPYIYYALKNIYVKMNSDALALASASGLSEKPTIQTITSIFFVTPDSKKKLFSQLRDPIIEKSEKIGDEDCYVISGATPFSKKATFWISKSRYIILKHSYSYAPPEIGWEYREPSEKSIKLSLKLKNLEASEENVKMERNRMRERKKNLRGSYTEIYEAISFPDLGKKDFRFSIPKGAVLEKTLF